MRPIATFCLLTALLLSGSILPAAASQAFPATLSSLHKEPAGQDGDDTGIDAVAGASGEKYAVPGSRGAAQSGTPGAQNATAGNAPQHADGQPDATAAGTQGKPTVVYTFPIDGDIMPAQQRLVAKCLADARSGGAELVLIRLNTYGGLVNAADSIRTMILNSPVPVWVFIDNQAASAGALIAIAAERIYMRPGGSIGAASVVDQNGKPMPDKFQSFMRATMRATAEAHGKVIERIDGDDTLWRWRRDPQVAEAMVGRTVGDSTTAGVLAFTASEASEHHYSEGTASTVDEVLAQGGVQQYTLHEYTPTRLDRLLGWLMNPVVQGIFVMMIVGGIYFELQTPGIGFALVVAILGAVLYFAPLYIEGVAQNWELILFIIGLALLAVEIFVLRHRGRRGDYRGGDRPLVRGDRQRPAAPPLHGRTDARVAAEAGAGGDHRRFGGAGRGHRPGTPLSHGPFAAAKKGGADRRNEARRGLREPPADRTGTGGSHRAGDGGAAPLGPRDGRRAVLRRGGRGRPVRRARPHGDRHPHRGRRALLHPAGAQNGVKTRAVITMRRKKQDVRIRE